jgi:hypothetical protein
MPQLVQTYSPRNIGETVLFSMDLSLNLQPLETLASTVWTCTLIAGTGTDSVTNRIYGSPSINGTIVSQLVDFTSGMTSGSTYILSSSTLTSLGQTLIGYSHVTVNAES